MTLGELIAAFRADADDRADGLIGVAEADKPYLWRDADVRRWFNEAVDEACIRRRLIHDSGIRVSVKAGNSVYELPGNVYEISHISFRKAGASTRENIRLVSYESMARMRPDWREGAVHTNSWIDYAIQTDRYIRLVDAPNSPGTLYIEGYRTPLEPMKADADEPELHSMHHRRLVDWVNYRAFSVPDSEVVSAGRAAAGLAFFTAYFGERPDADMRRNSRHDTPQVNQPFMV